MSNDEQLEAGVAAQGIAKAAEMLAGKYHLVITNVPYLSLRKQNILLLTFCDKQYPTSKFDIATAFLDRCLRFCYGNGSVSVVLPQNWLFLSSYSDFRQELLMKYGWHCVAWLGSGAFETITGEVVKSVLFAISKSKMRNNFLSGIDVSNAKKPTDKSDKLKSSTAVSSRQVDQLKNPDSRVLIAPKSSEHVMLGEHAHSYAGVQNGDSPRFIRVFWEISNLNDHWAFIHNSPSSTALYDGMTSTVYYDTEKGHLRESREVRRSKLHDSDQRGKPVWGKRGVLVGRMGLLSCTVYVGNIYDQNAAVVFPVDEALLLPIYAYCSSRFFHEAVRKIDLKINVTNLSLVKVPFDLEHWQQVAKEKYPHGLPQPYADDPTQWIFHGHPCGSVVWDEQTKRTAHGPLRTDATVLQVAIARLLGYRWPTELDETMELAPEMREWVQKSGTLLPYADTEGIVTLHPTRGKDSADVRLRSILAAAYGGEWSEMTERRLLQATGGSSPAASLAEWIRDKFFEEHCKLFNHRPFIWHIWDGRKDGFSVLVNYHKLAGAEGRRVLEYITYSLLGDWIGLQKAEQRESREGAEGRTIAAEALQEQLIKIIDGEIPYDIFVRWKPLGRQPVGWEPDINDGVRLNIRPFLLANPGGKGKTGVLRQRPNINWKKDRGNESMTIRPKEDFPWFWKCDTERNPTHNNDFRGGDGFDGIRWNDLHYSKAKKQAAKAREGSS